MPQSSSPFSSNPSLPIGHLSVAAPLRNLPAGVDPARDSLNRLQQLVGAIDSTLRLPNSPRAFAIYLLGLFIVFIGAFLHVLVAAQIMQAEFTLAQLQEEYRAIEQQNGDLIFQIARRDNMARLHQEIVAAGYVPVKEREYIFVPPTIAAKTEAPEDTLAADAVPPATAPTADQEAAIVAATQPTQVATTPNAGQWAQWEAFWRDTLGMAAGNTAMNAAASTASNTSTSNTSTSNTGTNNTGTNNTGTSAAGTTTSNFWAVWWEQGSAQGAKLLEQILGQ